MACVTTAGCMHGWVGLKSDRVQCFEGPDVNWLGGGGMVCKIMKIRRLYPRCVTAGCMNGWVELELD